MHRSAGIRAVRAGDRGALDFVPAMRGGADTKAHYVALLKEAGRAISARRGYHDSLRAPD